MPSLYQHMSKKGVNRRTMAILGMRGKEDQDVFNFSQALPGKKGMHPSDKLSRFLAANMVRAEAKGTKDYKKQMERLQRKHKSGVNITEELSKGIYPDDAHRFVQPASPDLMKKLEGVEKAMDVISRTQAKLAQEEESNKKSTMDKVGDTMVDAVNIEQSAVKLGIFGAKAGGLLYLGYKLYKGTQWLKRSLIALKDWIGPKALEAWNWAKNNINVTSAFNAIRETWSRAFNSNFVNAITGRVSSTIEATQRAATEAMNTISETAVQAANRVGTITNEIIGNMAATGSIEEPMAAIQRTMLEERFIQVGGDFVALPMPEEAAAVENTFLPNEAGSNGTSFLDELRQMWPNAQENALSEATDAASADAGYFSPVMDWFANNRWYEGGNPEFTERLLPQSDDTFAPNEAMEDVGDYMPPLSEEVKDTAETIDTGNLTSSALQEETKAASNPLEAKTTLEIADEDVNMTTAQSENLVTEAISGLGEVAETVAEAAGEAAPLLGSVAASAATKAISAAAEVLAPAAVATGAYVIYNDVMVTNQMHDWLTSGDPKKVFAAQYAQTNWKNQSIWGKFKDAFTGETYAATLMQRGLQEYDTNQRGKKLVDAWRAMGRGGTENVYNWIADPNITARDMENAREYELGRKMTPEEKKQIDDDFSNRERGGLPDSYIASHPKEAEAYMQQYPETRKRAILPSVKESSDVDFSDSSNNFMGTRHGVNEVPPWLQNAETRPVARTQRQQALTNDQQPQREGAIF